MRVFGRLEAFGRNLSSDPWSWDAEEALRIVCQATWGSALHTQEGIFQAPKSTLCLERRDPPPPRPCPA
ncbi:hypothetical protein PsYK624_163150 [Phanerochaete sordida]|uniref:Uncharacterized protein n=1 Tax=Phanerochaete sordida TaxID=48140 RepID=A0A9P3GQN7_9APHY|nr:hypothetical protein PsYK624_163150 [Phanerochaete sordida]